MEEDYNKIPIVVDNGSATIKTGFAGEKFPRAILLNMVAPTRTSAVMVGRSKSCYVGEEAWRLRDLLDIKYPVEDGIVTNWNEMENILHHMFFNELRVNPDKHPLLLTESPLNPNANREKMAQILFETFHIPSLYLTNGHVLSLYSQGRTTGLAVDSGFAATYTLPVFKGQVHKHCMTRVSVGGRDLTRYMLKLLSERRYYFCMSKYNEIANDIIWNRSYISMDAEKERSRLKMHELPDGQEILVDNQSFRVTEPIFNPYLIGERQGGIHKAIYESISKSDVDLRKYLYNNIVLAGGNSMFPGISERLHREMSHLAADVSIKVIAPPERIYSTWKGGSILASMDNFEKIAFSYSEYCEHGATIIHRKCI